MHNWSYSFFDWWYNLLCAFSLWLTCFLPSSDQYKMQKDLFRKRLSLQLYTSSSTCFSLPGAFANLLLPVCFDIPHSVDPHFFT
jgi:hypothetical protein